ncbi:SMP-30/gluconolactonase/LRE family protein [Streptomyces sp. NPDC057623]|uniref:SMP-30/gluconolactonase/LRE family protein n=1 Tax=Streptomyces sp. NPDC057623 TaxID=3346187 RepID=UPI0036AAB039
MTADPRPAGTLRPVGPDRLGLGEGARWNRSGVVLVDILAGRLLAVPDDPGAPPRTVARLPVPSGAVAPVAGHSGTWTVAAGTGICPPHSDGTLDWAARPEENARTRMRMNDAVADPFGPFWAGSTAYDADEDAGSLYRLDRDGTVVRVLEGITVPNGPAFTPDGSLMYLADSARGVVRRFHGDPVTAELGAPEEFVWGTGTGTGTVRRHLPDGSPDRTPRLPARQPAGVCLAHDVLYVTTARLGLAVPGHDDRALFAARVDGPGTPAPACRLDVARHPASTGDPA